MWSPRERILQRLRTLGLLKRQASKLVDRGVAVGSQAWVTAQTALADLDAIRGETVELVTDLEEVASARAQAGTPAYPALNAAIDEIARQALTQADRTKALEAALAG